MLWLRLCFAQACRRLLAPFQGVAFDSNLYLSLSVASFTSRYDLGFAQLSTHRISYRAVSPLLYIWMTTSNFFWHLPFNITFFVSVCSCCRRHRCCCRRCCCNFQIPFYRFAFSIYFFSYCLYPILHLSHVPLVLSAIVFITTYDVPVVDAVVSSVACRNETVAPIA